jgi:hypothetical protein
LDSSAYVKLPRREAEHGALLEELSEWDGYVSSALLAVEAIRACGRYGPEYAFDARAFLEGVALLPLDDQVLGEARFPGPDQAQKSRRASSRHRPEHSRRHRRIRQL